MDKEKKDKNIMIRISSTEKAEFEQIAKNNGFDSLSAYIMFLFRKHGK
jgi:hypothetical protein